MISVTRWAFWTALGALAAPIGLGGWLALGAPERGNGPGTTPVSGPGEAHHSVISLDSLGRVAGRTAPFRPDGRPSRVAYDPVRSQLPAEYAPPKPMLVLSGLVGGNAPLAVIEGIPGRDGPALLGVGDTLAGLKVRRITEGQVTVTGMDTTWVLVLRGLP